MIFNSYSFIVFAAVVILLHYLPLAWKIKKINLLTASYLFYAVWNPPFVLLLWLSTIIDFFTGKKIYDETNDKKRKAWLMLSLAINLGMLGFFKYGTFLLENFSLLCSLLGIKFSPGDPGIILPVGISFYTFQTLSYTLDMYYRRSTPERSLLDFSLFVTFFPQLVAGPIVRPTDLLPQFKTPHLANTPLFIKGMMLFSLGLFMKVVLADTMLSEPADLVFGSQQSLLALDAWMGVLAFSGQIFFDFAGYSTCAIGMANILGFTLTENFRYPYAANGFSDFWRRWHITLSSWLKDYVYVPLGGNRNGVLKTYGNLMITMLLGGLWHGASWTFVVWGGLHGSFLVVEKMIKAGSRRMAEKEIVHRGQLVVARNSLLPAVRIKKTAMNMIAILVTYFLVNLTWVFFRAGDFSTAWSLLESMFGLNENGTAILPTLDLIKIALITTGLLIVHYVMRNHTVVDIISKQKWWVLSLVWTVMLVLIIMSQKSSGSFIYFQF